MKKQMDCEWGSFGVDEDRALIERAAVEIAAAIGPQIPPGIVFTVLLYGRVADGAGALYVSNAARADMLKALRAFLEAAEKKELH